MLGSRELHWATASELSGRLSLLPARSARPGRRRLKKRTDPEDVSRYADMLAAMGTETRLRIMRLLLSAYPHGLVVGEIGGELGMAGSSLSHHLEKLKHEGLVSVKRESTFLR